MGVDGSYAFGRCVVGVHCIRDFLNAAADRVCDSFGKMDVRNLDGVVASERCGGKPVAWVTLVLGYDLAYVAAASVLATALKRLGTKAECVCMVTPDVPDSARDDLDKVFDHVVEVPYLETLALQKYSERFDAMYNYWLDKSFTKCGMFALVEYKKVIFLDADMLPLENPDELFDCPAPAGICSSVKDASENRRLHGVPLPRLLIDESLKNGQGNYGVRGCLLIMKPDLNVYHQIRSKVDKMTYCGSLESMVGPDEYLITQHFQDEWHHVHAKYGWVSWADRQDLGEEPCFLHYVSQKPWDEGEAWADFDYWKDEAGHLLRDVPDAIVYFSHITEAMAEMAGVALSSDIRTESKRLMEEARTKKSEEKLRREERAKELGIDLTSSTFMNGRIGSKNRGKQEGYSHSATHPAGPLTSARGTGERPSETVAVKVSKNVLLVSNFKRPNGANNKQKEKETRVQRPGKPKTSPRGNLSNKKEPLVPRLKLDNVVKNRESGGPKSASGFSGSHWKKKQGDSKADIDDWRAPSARLATPDRLTEELRPFSARIPPMTPTSSRRGAPYTQQQHSAKRVQTPKSSRADLATSWRSTPRTEAHESVNNVAAQGEMRLSHRGAAFHGFHDRGYGETHAPRAAFRSTANGEGVHSNSDPQQYKEMTASLE